MSAMPSTEHDWGMCPVRSFCCVSITLSRPHLLACLPACPSISAHSRDARRTSRNPNRRRGTSHENARILFTPRFSSSNEDSNSDFPLRSGVSRVFPGLLHLQAKFSAALINRNMRSDVFCVDSAHLSPFSKPCR